MPQLRIQPLVPRHHVPRLNMQSVGQELHLSRTPTPFNHPAVHVATLEILREASFILTPMIFRNRVEKRSDHDFGGNLEDTLLLAALFPLVQARLSLPSLSLLSFGLRTLSGIKLHHRPPESLSRHDPFSMRVGSNMMLRVKQIPQYLPY
jgi:hypothetical protein